MNTLVQSYGPVPGPLAVKIKEPSVGLFYWVITRLATQEHAGDAKVEASDHPYPTHESAMQAGVACMKALRSAASL